MDLINEISRIYTLELRILRLELLQGGAANARFLNPDLGLCLR